MKNYLFIIPALLILLAGCNQTTEISENSNSEVSAVAPQQQNDWVNEEILKQLSALRKEVKQLSKQVIDLRADINSGKAVVNKTENNSGLTVPLTSKRVMGDDKAPLAIVEFTDYECPYCVRFAQTTWPSLKREFVDTGKLKLVTYDFPLSIHNNAIKAAVAGRCSSAQGQYKGMRNTLFASSRNLKAETYTKAAQSLGMDTAQFATCMDNKDNVTGVYQDIALGKKLGVQGTPRFYVGRVVGDQLRDVTVISGAKSFSVFSQIIRKLM